MFINCNFCGETIQNVTILHAIKITEEPLCDLCYLSKLEIKIKNLENEIESYKTEVTKAYQYNKDINKWWQYKLERLQLSYKHNNNNLNSLPWKQLAKKLYKHLNLILKAFRSSEYDK